MISHRATSSITELLDDPMVRMVMEADRVDRQVLTAELYQIASRLENAKSQLSAISKLQSLRAPALREKVLAAAGIAAATRASLAVCGACCS